MKKITLLLLGFFLSIQPSFADTFDPGELFHHKYEIKNGLNCPIKIIRIRKCWDAPITNPAWVNPFTNVAPRSWISRTTTSGCYEYNPNYEVKANFTDKWWDIDFLTKSAIKWVKVDSTFQYWYEVIWGCAVSYEKTDTSVSSDLVWTLCWNNIAENNITIDGRTYTEQCDDWRDWDNDGCSDVCVLEPVTVTLDSDKYSDKDSLTATLSSTKTSFADYTTFQDWKWNTINNPIFPRTITYSGKGSYWTSVSVISNFWSAGNPWDRNPNFALPTATASRTLTVTDDWGGGWTTDPDPVTPPPGGGWWTICWNWVVEAGEECDSLDRSICNASCKLVNINNTIDIEPEPNDLEVVWWKQSITDSFRLKNTEDTPINLANYLYCVKRVSQVKDNWSNFSWESIQTQSNESLDTVKCGQVWVVWGNLSSEALKTHTTGWEWRVNDFNNQEEYVDNKIISWIDDGDQIYEPWEIKSEKTIRVAAPTITNISSWSVFWKLVNMSNLSKILEWLFDDARSINKNFVTVSIDNTKESYVDNIYSDNTIISKAESLWKQDKSAVSAADDIVTWATSWWNKYISDLIKYKGHSNILVLDKWNLVINNLSDIKAHTTYIVEEWDLIIEDDIEYSWDYSAFVVKKWNIRIPKWVTDIKWIFMTMIDNQWFFSYDREYTRNKLIVDGALYWNVEDLVHYRTYIEYDLTNRQLNVWTVVDLTSEILQNPPPLLTKFLNDYIELRKVAR